MRRDEWKLLYEAYHGPLYLYALSLTKNKEDAEDLLQETFVKAFLSYKEGGSIKYWLVTVLRNEYFNVLRKRKKEFPDGGERSEIEEGTEDIIEALIRAEERRRLFHEIRKLPERMREVLMAGVYLRMKDSEIGQVLGITEQNVRQIRSRAKRKLIERMKEEG